MAEDKGNFDENGMRVKRERRSLRGVDRGKIARRVLDFVKMDESARTDDISLRLQRYAKYRMWVEDGGDWPWEDSSNVALPDIATDVLALQDTLHNAVMGNRPIANARAIQKKDVSKQDKIDDLLDTQVFIEQDGEKAVEESADCFVLDGGWTAFIPWVREDRDVTLFRTWPELKEGEVPRARFEKILRQEFMDHLIVPKDDDGWDWEITDKDDQTFSLKFYTAKDGEVEMVGKKSERVYDGPKIIVKDYEDVLTPAGTANLRIPGPSNPGGATHVILVDHPTIDEIERLVDSDFYDLVTKKDLRGITSASESKTEEGEALDLQKQVLAGKQHTQDPDDDSHKTLTRYLCFDIHEGMDMMWWVLKEPALLLKAKPLTEMYPMQPPRRPLAEASLIPVKGQREGISLIELMESTHDLKKQVFDQMVDAGTLGNLPFWFYRAGSNIKPEVMRMWPGDGMPLSDPKNDVHFPNINTSQATNFGMNLLTVADQMQEKATVRGDMQLGRVPVGRSSALRTSENMQMMMSAAEARPERILRRFLMGWIEVFKQIHELNQHFLPPGKKFRIIGIRDPKDDPYREIETLRDIEGRYQFDFSVNVMNSSKLAMQEALEKLMGFSISEIFIQMGIVQPEGIYRMLYDMYKAHGQPPERYLSEPSPDALLPPILAEEAVSQIMAGEMPAGTPMEGAQAHLDKLQEFMNTDNFGYLDTPGKVDMFRSYLSAVSQRLKMEQMAKSAGQVGAQPQGPGGLGGPAPDMSNPPVQGGELLDETLPTAGGGANPGGNGGVPGGIQ